MKQMYKYSITTITSVQSNLAKGRIAKLSALGLQMDSSDLDPHLARGSLGAHE